jgi:hypothetical protein
MSALAGDACRGSGSMRDEDARPAKFAVQAIMNPPRRQAALGGALLPLRAEAGQAGFPAGDARPAVAAISG